MDIHALVRALGGTKEVATLVGVSASAVTNWIARGGIPREHHLLLWRRAVELGVAWSPPEAEDLRLIICGAVAA